MSRHRRRDEPSAASVSDLATGRAHEPVLYDEVLAALLPRAGGCYVDGTIGGGGHARGILERSAPDGRLLGIDRDEQALAVAREELGSFGDRLTLKHGNFAAIGRLVREAGFFPADGILLDIGVSSMQLSAANRGFSFMHDGPLDMRMDLQSEVTAESLVNRLSESELADLIYEYGEERQSRRIARAIVMARPLRTTTELADAVAGAVPRRGRLHPATRTFQALRIAANDELEALAEGLRGATQVLAPGARLAVISFHSLEDRLVKNYFRQESVAAENGHGEPSLRVITRHPLQPTREEQERNPRSRSAKLRVVERIGSADTG